MNRKLVFISLLSFLVLMSGSQIVKAATITNAVSDKTTYTAGQTGFILVTIYNDKNSKIRVTELSATINYYYNDGTPYVQKFFTSDTLPDEIQPGDSSVYQVPISLPTNIANGYTNPLIQASTEIWDPQGTHWSYSDHPTYTIKLYIESAYRGLYDDSQTQLDQQKAANASLNNTTNMLALATVSMAAAAGILMFLMFARRARTIPSPQA